MLFWTIRLLSSHMNEIKMQIDRVVEMDHVSVMPIDKLNTSPLK